MIKPNNYYVTSRVSRQTYSGRDVYMYINSYQVSSVIDLLQYCTEKKGIEVCAAQINISNHLIILLCIYRSPSGNFGGFAVQLASKEMQAYGHKMDVHSVMISLRVSKHVGVVQS